MLVQRVIGVLKLDVNTFEEIEADESATTQAALVVAIVAIVGGLIGGAVGAAMDGSFFGTFLSILLNAFIGWVVWSGVTYFVGTSLMGGKATMGEMLRVIGFAQAPGILAIIPVCGSFIGWLWSLACGFIAIRQGLDLDNVKALITIVVGFIGVFIVSLIVGAILTAVGLTVPSALGALGG